MVILRRRDGTAEYVARDEVEAQHLRDCYATAWNKETRDRYELVDSTPDGKGERT